MPWSIKWSEKVSLPKCVLGITFGARADRRRPKILETSTQFLRRPAELFIRRVPEAENSIIEVFKEVVGQVGPEEAPPQGSHRSRLSPGTGCRNDEYHDVLRHDFGLAKISGVTLAVEVSPGSYERIIIHIKHAAFVVRFPATLSDSSRVVLGVPCLCGVDDGESKRQIRCRVMRGHPNLTLQLHAPQIDRDIGPVPVRDFNAILDLY